MAVGPVAAPFAAMARMAGASADAAAIVPPRSAISLPAGSLVSEGDTGAAVAAVQRQGGVDDDGIFGPITRRGGERFQAPYGLAVTGGVDAPHLAALFKSNLSFVCRRRRGGITGFPPGP